MEGVILVVTRENCEALIGKNVRVIVSDSKEEEEKGVTEATNASEETLGPAAVKETSGVLCTSFLRPYMS